MYNRAPSLIRFIVVAALASTAFSVYAKDHSAKYQVGVFSSTGQLSDGSFAYCSGGGCAAYSAGHNIHYVRTQNGMYAIEAPVSVGKTVLLGVMTGAAYSPTIHQEWFMDQLHEGDKVLFASRCNKHNNCTFWLPYPDKAGKEYITVGYYRADVAKTNTQTLCGKGKLAANVEAQVCPASATSAAAQTPASQPVAQSGKF